MSRYLIPRPRSSEGTILPATLAALLALMLGLQFALVRSDAPDGDMLASPTHIHSTAVPAIAAVTAASVIREQPIFAPDRATGGGSGADPLGGAQVSGSWGIGRQMNVVLRESNGDVRTLHVGQAVGEWVLASATTGGARFLHDGKTITIPFGASAPPTPTPDASQKEDQGQ